MRVTRADVVPANDGALRQVLHDNFAWATVEFVSGNGNKTALPYIEQCHGKLMVQDSALQTTLFVHTLLFFGQTVCHTPPQSGPCQSEEGICACARCFSY
jgi:hypothetical protein